MSRVLVGCLVVSCLAACGPDAVSGSDGSADDPLLDLERETGHRWLARYHEDVPTPAFLDGKTAPLAATPADAERAARAFLRAHAALFRLSTVDDELQTVDATTDELGMTHVRFAQQKERIPVFGAELVVHFDADGSLVRINGRYLPFAAPPLVPARTSEEAQATALADASALRPDVDAGDLAADKPLLVLFPRRPDEPHLAWQLHVDVHDQTRPMRLETFVNALDGRVLHRVDALATVDGSGVGVLGDAQPLTIAVRKDRFWLEDASRGEPPQKTYSAAGRVRLPGAEVQSAKADHWDETGTAPGAAVDAHAYVARVWDYFRKVHGRAGWDGRGHGVHATVHFGDHNAGAFFDGKQLVFGDGDAQQISPAAALDVVAHEFTHGLVAHTARLSLEGQPGALHEAIADAFGCFVSRGVVPGGDWQVGETLARASNGRHALRDLAQPQRTSNPATLAEWVATTDDNGGIHVNSTIASHAVYLMSDGEGGLGAEATARIWYRALTHYLTSQARFVDAADETIAAARELGLDERPVHAAWVAVGVMPP